MENIITGTNIGKIFDGNVEVLKNINFNIEKGDIYGLVGRSGAGKSTLLRCINGLISYDTGSLKVYDKEINLFSERELREFRKKIGMIFQHFSLIERRSVYHNIAIPMECWGYKEKKIRERVMNLLNLVGLEEKADVRPRQLSGGQKQRVAIARALAMKPDILLCDEATSALDPNTTNAILELLYKINQEMGITIVMVTHQMDVVRRICRNMAIIENGTAEIKGNVEEIFKDDPPQLKRLLGTQEVKRFHAKEGN